MEKFLFKIFSKFEKKISFDRFSSKEFRKFLKCMSDVRELFSSDDVVYKSLAKFADYLREIQQLFSVNRRQ